MACHQGPLTKSSSNDKSIQTATGIVGGQVANSKNFSNDAGFLATVGLKSLKRNIIFCTGTLIKRNIVLTAAHCLAGVEISDIRIVSQSVKKEFRVINRKSTGSVNQQTYDVLTSSDLAVLLLNEEIQLPAKPAQLLRKDFKDGTSVQIRAFSYGKTTDSEDLPDGQLRSVDLVGKVEKGLTTPDALYYDQTNEKGLCSGDSGGPAFIYNNDGNVFVIGVHKGIVLSTYDTYLVSLGVKDKCKINGRSQIITQKHLSWIENATNSLIGKLSCESNDKIEGSVRGTIDTELKFKIIKNGKVRIWKKDLIKVTVVGKTNYDGRPAQWNGYIDDTCITYGKDDLEQFRWQ